MARKMVLFSWDREEVEFPARIPKDENEIVLVKAFCEVYRVTRTIKSGRLIMPKRVSFLGGLDAPFWGTGRDLLKKFGKLIPVIPEIISNEADEAEIIYAIRFKTLLAGYQLLKKSRKEFERVLKSAKTEKEFCTLAGLS